MSKRAATQSSAPSSAEQPQSMEQLQDRYQRLHRKKIETETELKTARRRLDELQAEAREKYGTDDLTALEEKLAAMKAENEAKRAEYQKSLDQIDADLSEVETRFAATEADPAAEGSDT